MTIRVPWAGRTITVDARWRLALAVAPTDAVTGLPVRDGLLVGVEPARPRPLLPPRGRTFTPAPRVDRPLPRNRGGTYTLVHHLRRPDPPGGPVHEVVLRLVDPTRGRAPRRLRVPVWNLAQVAAAEATPPGPAVPASARQVAPWLFPGAAFVPPGGSTGLRGRLVRAGAPLRWARVTATVGPDERVLGRAHADDRGEFLLLLSATGTEPLAPPSQLTVRLRIRAPAPAAPVPGAVDADPWHDLVVEDAVRRDPGAVPGELDAPTLRGERDPASYVLVPERPAVDLTTGAVTASPALIVT